MAANDGNNLPKVTGSYSVYLRIKPADVNRITDDVTGLTVNEDSVTVLSHRKREEVQRDEFKFTNVFKPTCSQKEIFDAVVHPRLVEFLDGEDSLIFCYGTTNSGKSFTMQGTPSRPGIIPRVLRAVFSSIGDLVDTDHPLIPYRTKDATVLDQKVGRQILNIKKALLDSVTGSIEGGNMDGTISSTSPENLHFDDEAAALHIPYSDCLVGVWVSFYEIYNEVLNDLLSPAETPTPLNVVKDLKEGSFYPDGVLQVPVDSWEEAFNVYRAGKKKLQVSSTLMNRLSSRSHCVFTVTLLVRPASDPSAFYDLNNLTFCDLAGNERVSHHEGTSVTSLGKKETLKINSSLLALNRCFVMLRSNLGKHAKAMPSFRESKLTMVFKKFLTKKGRLSMLANISQDPEMLASTLHILKMTAVACSTRVDAPETQLVRARRRFSMAYEASAARLVAIPETDSLGTHQPTQSEVADLEAKLATKTAENNVLIRELDALRSRCEGLEIVNEQLSTREQHDSESDQRQKSYVEELEAKLRLHHKKELELLSRLHNYQDTCEEQFERLAEAHDIKSSDPKHIVERAISKNKQTMRMAYDELQELAEEKDALDRQLQVAVLELASVNGQLIQVQTELETERDMTASLGVQIQELRKQLESSRSTDGSCGPHVENESASGYEATFEEGRYSRHPVRAHRSLRWLSDDESSPRVPTRAATTAKKRKGRKKKNEVPPPEPVLAPRRAPRRRLLPRAAGTDHLDISRSGNDLSVQELQPSPNTIMRSARTHK